MYLLGVGDRHLDNLMLRSSGAHLLSIKVRVPVRLRLRLRLGLGVRVTVTLTLSVTLTPGALFHIDFGYILGRDPKPFPPPMKLCKEMVEAMGGAP